MQQQTYPVHFSVDYPDRQLDRLTTFFRVFIVLPIAIVLGVISGENWQWTVNGKTIPIRSWLWRLPLSCLLLKWCLDGGSGSSPSLLA